jgi:hypothetical protein
MARPSLERLRHGDSARILRPAAGLHRIGPPAGCAAWPAKSAYDDGFARARPESVGVSPAAISAYLDELQAAKFEMHSFMLYRGGHVIAEGWWAPYRADRIHMTHSLTKSVAACGVGFALAEKALCPAGQGGLVLQGRACPRRSTRSSPR